MTTATGVKPRITGWGGCPVPWPRAGRRTATATGPGWNRGAGRRSTMPRGASRRSNMAVGCTWAAAGRGCGAPDGVTVVSHETFVRSRPVNRSVIVVPRDRLEQAPVVGSTARIVPDRQSVLGQPAIVEVRRPPAAVTTREVVVHRQPPPPPLPFANREQALRARPGRPLDDATLTSLRARSPDASARPLVRPAAPATRLQGPAQELRPAREGLPPSRAALPTVTPPPGERSRPARG